MKKETKKNKLFIFYDTNFYALHGKKLSRETNRSLKCYELVIPSGEKIKSEKELTKIYNYLLSEKISRSDFIVADDDIYFLEVNTLPGLTEHSLVPKSLAAVGCSYNDFIEHLLTDALTVKR